MNDTALFTASEHITDIIAQYEGRLATVRQRYQDFHPDVTSRRYVADSWGDASRNLRAAKSWQAGEYDRTYAGPHPSFGETLQDFRDHYADDSLRATLHYLLDAEHYAGLRDRDSVLAEDPWRR